jgi:hypothetical protein
MRRAAAGALVALACLLACATPAAARGLTLGVMDFTPFSGADNGIWYGRTVDAGATLVRLTASWSGIATRRPANPRDPFDPAYDWTRLDAAVRGAADHGLQVFITAQYAPRWAEGAHRPKSALPGSWKPDPSAYADFMEALARRYDGAHGLPRVRDFQPWNEPNLPRYLSPQWRGRSPVSPGWYRRLLNGAYARVKAVHADNLVVAAGTSPYGDPPEANNRMTPVRFLRVLLSKRTTLDAIDHHPYATGSPTDHALLGENVAIPDLGKLVRVLHAAQRRHTVRPAGRKRVWVTEVSWDSRPPDPQGVPEGRRVRWLQDAVYSLWRQGADTICWYLLRDDAPIPSYDTTYQSGLYTHAGAAKPAARAFRLPIVLRRQGGRTRIWGHTSVAGPVTVERRRGGSWTAIASFTPSGGIYQGRLKIPRGAQVRARQGAATGLARKVP